MNFQPEMDLVMNYLLPFAQGSQNTWLAEFIAGLGTNPNDGISIEV